MEAPFMQAATTSGDTPGKSSQSAAEHRWDTYWFLEQPCPLLGKQETHRLLSSVPLPVHWFSMMFAGLHAVALHVLHSVVSLVVLPCSSKVYIKRMENL